MKTEEVTPAQIARECVDNFDFDSYEEPEGAREYLQSLAAPLQDVPPGKLQMRLNKEEHLCSIRDTELERGHTLAQATQAMAEYLDAECTRVYGNAVCYWCGRVAGQCECQCQREGWRPTTI